MEKKKIVLLYTALALTALPTLGHVATVARSPYVLHHIDGQFLVACLGAISAILVRPMIRDQRQRWRNRRVATRLDSTQGLK